MADMFLYFDHDEQVTAEDGASRNRVAVKVGNVWMYLQRSVAEALRDEIDRQLGGQDEP